MRFSIFLLLFTPFVGYGQDAPSSPHQDAITRIEHSLLPFLQVEGHIPDPVKLEERMDFHGVPGISVAVLIDGDIAWARAYGMADVASGRAATPSTLFQAASISKPVAATAAHEMVERGLLDLDANVNEYLTSFEVGENEFTESEKVTLRRIMNHTAGLTVWGFPGYFRSTNRLTTAEVLYGAGNTALIEVYKTPGESWQYSGGGYTVMQQVMEDQTNEDFASLMNRLVLYPLGMRLSTYEQPLPEHRHSEAASGYRDNGDVVRENWHVYPEQAAAGLWTTPSDLLRFAMSIQRAAAGSTNELLTPDTVAEMLTPGMNNYGLGPGVRGDGKRFGHGGANAGFRCNLDMSVDGRFGVAVMTNSDSGSALATELMLAISNEYGWGSYTPDRRKAITLSEAQQQALVGTYKFDNGREYRVFVQDGELLVQGDNWGDETLMMYASSPNELFDSDDGFERTFNMVDGRATSMTAGGRTGERINDQPDRPER